MHNRVLFAALCGGLTAGTLDVGVAALLNSVSPLVVLVFIASGILGKAAYHAAAAGLILGRTAVGDVVGDRIDLWAWTRAGGSAAAFVGLGRGSVRPCDLPCHELCRRPAFESRAAACIYVSSVRGKSAGNDPVRLDRGFLRASVRRGAATFIDLDIRRITGEGGPGVTGCH